LRVIKWATDFNDTAKMLTSSINSSQWHPAKWLPTGLWLRWCSLKRI